MNGKRILHIAMGTLAVVGATLVALEKVSPAWAAPVAVALALVTNLETALSVVVEKAAISMFAVLLIGQALYGCATTAKVTTPVVSVVKKCASPTSEFSALVLDTVDGASTVDTAITEAEIFAAQTAVCTITQIAKDVLTAATGVKLAAPAGPPPMREQWAQAWIKVHP